MQPAISLIVAIVAIALFFLVAIVLKGNHGHHFNVEEYQTRWLKIQNSLIKGNSNSYTIGVLEADKLFDRAMREMGIPGKTMGERLKRMDGRLSQIDYVWHAHKIRNQIAHDTGYAPDYNNASRALSAYKQALKDLGAI